MGRTNPTYRDALRALEQRWGDYRRGLRRRDKAHFDRLFEHARAHADAASYLNHEDPVRPLLVSVALAQEAERTALEAEVGALTERVESLEGQVESLAGAVETRAEEVEALAERVAALERALADGEPARGDDSETRGDGEPTREDREAAERREAPPGAPRASD